MIVYLYGPGLQNSEGTVYVFDYLKGVFDANRDFHDLIPPRFCTNKTAVKELGLDF